MSAVEFLKCVGYYIIYHYIIVDISVISKKKKSKFTCNMVGGYGLGGLLLDNIIPLEIEQNKSSSKVPGADLPFHHNN